MIILVNSIFHSQCSRFWPASLFWGVWGYIAKSVTKSTKTTAPLRRWGKFISSPFFGTFYYCNENEMFCMWLSYVFSDQNIAIFFFPPHKILLTREKKTQARKFIRIYRSGFFKSIHIRLEIISLLPSQQSYHLPHPFSELLCNERSSWELYLAHVNGVGIKQKTLHSISASVLIS